MTTAALGLILTAAVLHAAWNLLAKRAGGGTILVWLYGTTSAVLLTPLAAALIFIHRPALGPPGWSFTPRQRRHPRRLFRRPPAGISTRRPLGRLSGRPGHRPGPDHDRRHPPARRASLHVALLGAALVALSVFALAMPARAATTDTRRAVAFGLLTGILIAAYTICDKQAVGGTASRP